MSREYETRKVQYDTEDLAGVTCDLCGAKSRLSGWGYNLKYSQHNTDEITISRKLGDEYPGSGSGTTGTFDVCPKCWETKLVPWFESQGAHCQTKEWDY